MLKGISLMDLATRITKEAEERRDFVVPARAMHVMASEEPGRSLSIVAPAFNPIEPNRHMLRQIEQWAKVPGDYADRIRAGTIEDRQLYAANVNHWLARSSDRRMIRTLPGAGRAFLSDRYRRIDNHEVLTAVLPVLHDQPGMEIASCEINDTKLFLKATFPRIQREVAKGDIVEAGVLISNSEVGDGSYRVEPFAHRLICLNGAVINAAKGRANHVGRRQGEGELITVELSDDTMAAEDKALMLKMRDIVRAAVNGSALDMFVEQAQEKAGIRVEKIAETIEITRKRFALTEAEAGAVTGHFMEGGAPSLWGLVNAITKTAHANVTEIPRSIELERVGGTILSLAPSEYRELLAA